MVLSHVPHLLMDYLIDNGSEHLELANNAGLHRIVRWILKRYDSSKLPPLVHDLRFLRGVVEAARQGNISLLEAWYAHFPHADGQGFRELYEVAVRKGHAHLLEWLLSRGSLVDNESTANMIKGIAYSRPVVVYWLHSHFPKIRLVVSIQKVASRPNNEECLEFLDWLWNRKKRFILWDKRRAQTIAAQVGNLPVLAWLYDHGVGESRICTLEMAARFGHFEVVKWLYDRLHSKINIPPTPHAIVYNGHFEIFNWLFERLDSFGSMQMDERRLKWACDEMKEAALQGELDTLKRVYDIAKDKFDQSLLFEISTHGHVDVLEWLLDHLESPKLSHQMVNIAATYGHLPMVQFLCGKGLSGSLSAVDDAADRDHFEVVKWLYEYGLVASTKRAMDAAASVNRLDIVQWLHANQLEGCSKETMDSAAANGSIEMVEWLHAHRSEGCSVHAMDGAASNGHLQMLEWLPENRSEGCSKSAIVGAAWNGHLGVVQWLHAHYSLICDYENAKERAIANGQLKVAQWLNANCGGVPDMHCLLSAIYGSHVSAADWIYNQFSYQYIDESEYLSGTYSYIVEVSDPMLEWLMVQFPTKEAFAHEVHRRVESLLQARNLLDDDFIG